jgi:hypothetical protein
MSHFLTLIIAQSPSSDREFAAFAGLRQCQQQIAQVWVIGEAVTINPGLERLLHDVKSPWHYLTRLSAVDWNTIATPLTGYIPPGATPAATIPEIPRQPCVMPWLVAQPIPLETAHAGTIAGLPWIASTSLIQEISDHLIDKQDLQFINLVNLLEAHHVHFYWGTAIANAQPRPNSGSQEFPIAPYISAQMSSFDQSPLTADSSVLALVPHYQCERWLSRCLRSLVDQSRPLDGIVVIDDGSGHPPIKIVQKFPQVTLLASSEQVGPYRLIQQVIQDTQDQAYLFQDADDWSSGDRLERLLAIAEQTGAELVGTQELRIIESDSDVLKVVPVCYPLDVNQALSEKPGHGLLHPSSLVSRDLVIRLGGFATGFRFGADTEFLLRAVFAARVVNSGDYGYFRRKRPGSLTTDPVTGLDSMARQQLTQRCKARARANHAAMRSGQLPDLSPLSLAPAIELHHIAGPEVRLKSG